MSKTTFATNMLSKEEIQTILGDSSGMILEENRRTIKIGYVDFDVSEFGGSDYECFYELDAKNTKLFKAALKKRYTGKLFDMCVQAFTIKFSNNLFESFCIDNNIEYRRNTY